MKRSFTTVVFLAACTVLLFGLFVMLALWDHVQWSASISAAIVGACVGSFANVVVYRLPLMMQAAWESECRAENEDRSLAQSGEACGALPDACHSSKALSLMWPPSACPKCAAGIRCWHNVPVLGFLMLRGRCADCAAPISARYPGVEAVFAVAFAALGWVFGPGLELFAYGCAFTLLVMLALIDWDTQLLPDSLTQPLLWMGLLLNAQGFRVSLDEALYGVVLAYGTFWLISRSFRYLRGHDGMGEGDLKLVAALCAWLGWQALPWIMCSAVLSSLLVTGCLVACRRTRWACAQPFGPHLALAGCLAAWAL